MKLLKLITRVQFRIIWFVLLVTLPFLAVYIYHFLPQGSPNEAKLDIGTLSGMVCIVSYAVIIISLGYLAFGEDGEDYFKNSDTNNNRTNEESIKIDKRMIKKWTYIIIGLFLLYIGYGFIGTHIAGAVKVYNTSKLYQNTYGQKTKERLGFYDKLWKIFLQKEKITNLNKDVFIEVSKIIMENRRDGQQVTWKWVSENTQIPYSQFTAFYSDLSDFIEKQREDYYNLEKECQQISVNNNIMLDTFPNNIYNKVLHCQSIDFSYGFLSDSTNNTFKRKTESPQ